MNYDFIRKLAVKVSEQEAGAIIKLLLSHNIEAYAEGTEENKKEGRIYIAAGKETRLSNGNLYVAAADRARAVELLKGRRCPEPSYGASAEKEGRQDTECDCPLEIAGVPPGISGRENRHPEILQELQRRG